MLSRLADRKTGMYVTVRREPGPDIVQAENGPPPSAGIELAPLTTCAKVQTGACALFNNY